MKQKTNADVVDLLAAILHGAPALPGAACVGRAELFDGTDPASTETAINLCRYRCTALAACERAANAAPHNSVSGVLAGRLHEWTPTTVRGRREVQRAAS
jgi:hypothetical protein